MALVDILKTASNWQLGLELNWKQLQKFFFSIPSFCFPLFMQMATSDRVFVAINCEILFFVQLQSFHVRRQRRNGNTYDFYFLRKKTRFYVLNNGSVGRTYIALSSYCIILKKHFSNGCNQLIVFLQMKRCN